MAAVYAYREDYLMLFNGAKKPEAMKERGKAVEIYNNDSDFNYSASEMPCRKHPSPSSVGICAYCLKEKLVKLVCTECGEQRLSLCSCSDISSYRKSCSTMEFGSVGRVSFNEKTDELKNLKIKRKGVEEKSEEVILLRRSSSSCVEVKKSNGLWKIKWLFKKKKSKRAFEKNGEFESFDDKTETWVSDIMCISTSRSLCSFRDEASDYAFSSAKISDVTSGVFLDSESEPRKSGFEPRKSGFSGGVDAEIGTATRSVYPVKESDFSAMDESAFIDLNLDLSAETKFDFSKKSDRSGTSLANLKRGGGSCRITVNERGLKKGSKGHKVWKWIFRHQSANNKEESSISKP
ncbi:unnamed protein product [Fraxinus pennsylvanica]|uniref:Uncharacterized protein n=1 Tax=Fraxinus pennsylvanica TaxID=56036 RepID=A0AAD1ZT05_9LAMI|nr:unnamed protein product [Fraxinus pennsylvanica]